MNITKINEVLKNLTPQQKLEFLQPIHATEKNKKNKKQIFLLITKIKEEKSLLEHEILKLEVKPFEKAQEEPLEQIVKEEAQQISLEQKDRSLLRLYGITESKEKMQSLYGIYNIGENVKYAQGKEKEYKSEPNMKMKEFQHGVLSESQKLEKENKNYETGME